MTLYEDEVGNARVGKTYDITGHELAAWVIPSATWRGKARWRPQVERKFVSWGVMWKGHRYKTFEQAKAKALKVMHSFDSNGGRREPH